MLVGNNIKLGGNKIKVLQVQVQVLKNSTSCIIPEYNMDTFQES